MRIRETLIWINQYSTSTVLLLFLLTASAFAHSLALVRMEVASRWFAVMDDRTVSQMGIIDFMHAHQWMAIVCGAVFLGMLLYLEFRKAPRWSVWITFCLLALPCMTYAGACLRIGNKIILWTTP